MISEQNFPQLVGVGTATKKTSAFLYNFGFVSLSISTTLRHKFSLRYFVSGRPTKPRDPMTAFLLFLILERLIILNPFGAPLSSLGLLLERHCGRSHHELSCDRSGILKRGPRDLGRINDTGAHKRLNY